MPTNIKNEICPICNDGNLVFSFTKNNFNIFCCSKCSHTMVYPIPSAEELKEIYAKDYFSGREAGFGYANYDRDKEAMRSIFESHLKTIQKKVGRTGRLLDIGAATGFFVALAKNFGWQASGVEISEYAASLGRERGLDISTGTILNLKAEPESFDVITLWDVLEHMPNPKENLERVFNLLKRDGIVVINTPDSGSLFAKALGRFWHLYVPPEHLHYFNQKSLSILLNSLNFKNLVFSKIGKRFTLLYVVETLATWQGFAFWKWLAKVLRKFPRFAKLALPIHLRDNMYILAVKS